MMMLESLVPGAEFRLVGGCIRDLILERKPKDWDIITNAMPDQMSSAGFEQVGAGFPVFLHKDPFMGQVEIACCRTERKIGKGHNSFETKVCQSFEEDAMRRDLTINACSWHYSNPDQVYCYNQYAENDFEWCYLRAMSPAFAEDPLRVFRVARFAAQLSTGTKEWTVPPHTMHMMRELEGELKSLPPDRVRSEFESAMFKAENHYTRNIFFKTLKSANALTYWFNELLINTMIPIPVVVRKGHEYEREFLYLGIAYMMARVEGTSDRAKDDVKRFCHRFQIGITSEMETFKTLSTIVPNNFSWGRIPTSEEIFKVCRSMMRGKLSPDDYIDAITQICRDFRYDQDAFTYFEMLRLICIALKEMKFTATDIPAHIRGTQMACVKEFMEIYMHVSE